MKSPRVENSIPAYEGAALGMMVVLVFPTCTFSLRLRSRGSSPEIKSILLAVDYRFSRLWPLPTALLFSLLLSLSICHLTLLVLGSCQTPPSSGAWHLPWHLPGAPDPGIVARAHSFASFTFLWEDPPLTRLAPPCLYHHTLLPWMAYFLHSTIAGDDSIYLVICLWPAAPTRMWAPQMQALCPPCSPLGSLQHDSAWHVCVERADEFTESVASAIIRISISWFLGFSSSRINY